MVIIHTEASLGWGGQEIRTVREAKGFKEKGHRVIIAAPKESLIYKRALSEGITAEPIEMPSSVSPRAMVRLKRIIDKYRAELVCTHSSIDSWLVSFAVRLVDDKPAIIRVRHLSTPIRKGALNNVLYNKVPERVITTSEAIRRQMIEENGFDGGRIVSIPTGVDLGSFNPKAPGQKVRRDAGFTDDDFIVGAVSVLRSWKGHFDLIEAAKIITEKNKNIKFIFAGEGPMRERIEERIKALSLESRVKLLGHRDDVETVLAALDLFAFPSYANEGVPQAVLQAMSMEKAIVASDLESIQEVIKDRATGVVVPPKDPQSLADAILSLYGDKALREALGRKARLFVEENYSFKSMVERLEGVYMAAVRSAGKAA